jgi:transcriptional regulator with XRE-family HTH domain
MSPYIDFKVASSTQIEQALGELLARYRLDHNLSQAKLAEEAGVSLRTIKRVENGEGASLDTFVRMLMALGLQENLVHLIPVADVRPLDRIDEKDRERQRARSMKESKPAKPWSWGDE